jgi:Inner membrane component of T3SS, cytoplasmic domain/Family of unknown function (DUF6519)
MAGDRARVSYDPSRQWRGVIAQQGRVTVEADWNEAAAIGEERDRRVALDVVGPVGTPDGGYAVTAIPREGERPGSALRHLTIGPGTLYLGGERLHLRERVHYATQPDWLDHSTDPMWRVPRARRERGTRHELVYLLAAEQEVSAVEDPALADVALGGPDTAQRQRILQHFVACPSESGTCEGSRGALERSLAEHGLRFDPASMTARSAARLKVSFSAPPGSRQPAATGGYLGAENQMIRVMVTRIDRDTGEPTIVWGFDNASFLYRVQADAGASTTTLTLASTPVDSYHYPQRGQAVELLRDAARLAGADYIASPAGFVTTAADAYQPVGKTLIIEGAPGEPGGYPADYVSGERTPQLYLRVWQATAHARPGRPVPLGDTGVSVTLTSDHGFHAGDLWHFALRPMQPAVVYPQRYLDAPQPPEGPRTWACPLAVVTWDDDEDEDREPTTASCVPRFSGLAGEAEGRGGCCTVDIGPEDADHGASLQALLDEHARRGPITVCLQPGTYTLPAPLVLGPDLDGITLQACQEGVVVQGPRRPREDFVLGLIAIRDAASVTIRGIELVPPHVRISPADRSFAGLHERNHRLLREYSRGLRVAIGISARDCVGLTIEDCIFDLPDPGRVNHFGAGVFATGAMDGTRITGCTFQATSLPTADHWRRRRERPFQIPEREVRFHDLARGEQAEPPHQLTFGYLQVPTFEPDRRRDRPQRLDDAVIEHCLFQGVTVPTLVIAHLGTLIIGHNTVRQAYGGFWLISLADPELSVMFDRIAIGDDDAYRGLSEEAGGAALLDRILVIATAIGQVLPVDPLVGERFELGRLLAADRALLELARQAFTGFYLRVSESAELPPEIDALFRDPDASATRTDIWDREPDRPRRLGRDGWRPRLRLDLGGCQIDAIIADHHGGAGLLVADFTGEAGSALIHDNRIRGRFPGGETAFVAGVAESCVTGNVVANEVEHEWQVRSHSLGLFPATTPPAVAITGNVFISPPRLPRRDVPPAYNGWDLLNTVIRDFTSAGETARVPAGPPLRMVVTNGPDEGRAFDLRPGGTRIGRDEGSDIQLEDPRISHEHAIVWLRGDEVTIADLGSTNGTRVNDVPVERETPITPGDRIELGGVRLELEQGETDPGEP